MTASEAQGLLAGTGFNSPSDALQSEFSAPASQCTSCGSPLHFMIFPVHCAMAADTLQHHDSDVGLDSIF